MPGTVALGIALALSQPGSAAADPSPPEAPRLEATSSTYVRWFQRALLPGPTGAYVLTETMAPVYESLVLRASHVGAPWGGGVALEFSGWGNGFLNNVPGESRFDGDVAVFKAVQRFGPAYVELGRQIITRGAARFARIDGLAAGIAFDSGLGLDAYGGFTVLPRWAERPGYYQLGSATDTLVRSPDALPIPKRSGYWAAGARAHYQHRELGQVGLSFHEEREQSELGRRNAALDVSAFPRAPVGVSGLFLLDVDSRRLSDARASVDFSLARTLDASADYRRTDPALFLSRQSVLGVFSTSTFDEIGADVRYRPFGALTLGASGYLDFFAGGERGGRVFLRAQSTVDSSRRLLLQTFLGRVVETENGYVSLRTSLRYRVFARATAVLEHASYFYDKPIRNVSTSTVDLANVEWSWSRELRLLVGGSVTQSPYASVDWQSLVRLVYGVDALLGGAR